jgi:hypothetical protein
MKTWFCKLSIYIYIRNFINGIIIIMIIITPKINFHLCPDTMLRRQMRMEVKVHLLMSSVPDLSGGWMGPRAGLGRMMNKEILALPSSLIIRQGKASQS